MAAPSKWHKPLIDNTLTYVDESGRTKKFDKVKILADGHCLFRAIAKQPRIQNNIFPTDQKLEIQKINWLRLKSVEALISHQNDDISTCGSTNKSQTTKRATIRHVLELSHIFETYCRNMSRQFDNENIKVSIDEYADQYVIMFMPDIIKLPVCILTLKDGKLIFYNQYEGMNNQHSGKEPVYLLHDEVGLHYDMLLPLEGDSLAGNVLSGVNRLPNQSPIPPSLMNREQLVQMLVGTPPLEANRILGELLYKLIATNQPNLAGKITGIFLEGLDNSELVPLIYDNVALESKIKEVLVALTAHKEAEALKADGQPQGQGPQKSGVPNPAQKSAQINYPQESQDYQNLKYLTNIYTRILKTASLQLELSAKFRPPKLGGNIDELELAGVFREWNTEYEYGKRVLQNCRNEFLNCEWTMSSHNFKLSDSFWSDTLDGWTEQWNKSFLQRNIDGFVKIMSSRIAPAGAEGREDEFAKLGLIEFQFEKQKVKRWVDFYTKKTKGKFPDLPKQCVRTSSSDSDFLKYQEMWAKIQQYRRPDTNPEEQRRLRKWYHTRACLAFHKAVRSARLNNPEQQALYDSQKGVTTDATHYFVVGSAMSTPIHPVEGKTNKYLVLGV